MTPKEFRDQHGNGDYTAWSDETYDLYFTLIADNAIHIASRVNAPADHTPRPQPPPDPEGHRNR
jgi:hypothetical protein